MKDEVVARLRGYVLEGDQYGERAKNKTTIALRNDIEKAADLIEQQALLIEELREGLEYIARRDGKDESGQTNWQKSVDRIQDVARSLLQSRRG